jgi:hypothetical protein
MDDFSGDLSGMAARAMSSSDPFGDVEGLASGRIPLPYAAHAPAQQQLQQRSPTHLQQMQQQQPGYATSPRYGAGPHGGGAPIGAPYGQPLAPYQQPGHQGGYQSMGAPAGMGMGQELIYVVSGQQQ